MYNSMVDIKNRSGNRLISHTLFLFDFMFLAPFSHSQDRYSDQDMYASGQASLYLRKLSENSIHLILCISPYVTHFRTTAPKLRFSPSFQTERGNEGNVFHFQILVIVDPLEKVASLGLTGFDG